ncbi:AKAP7 2'5' RNA ligase-like domain-containing protein [Mycena galericulata]|nr:AKAP7 2'5' RNA ligase-like domain-containing protein [Mycena galericulata]
MAPKARSKADDEGKAQTDASAYKRRRGAKGKPKNPQMQSVRPTHFLSLPLGHHPELRTRILEFHQKVLPSGDPIIEGLDQSILVDPRRLHFTLGVMALSSEDESKSGNAMEPKGKTLSEAVALLHALGPEIREVTQQPLVLSLDKMGVLKTQRQQAGVLYIGPGDENNDNTIKVNRILDLVGQRFRQEGFITETARPSVLHCTLINASHRKPRRIPRTFSYREIFDQASADVAENSSGPFDVSFVDSAAVSAPTVPLGSQNRTISVDFGAWAVSEIQICKMGSHGPENEYVSCASVTFG